MYGRDCCDTGMSFSPPRTDTLASHLVSGRWWPVYRDAVQMLANGGSTASAIRALGTAACALGGNGAIFGHLVQHDADLTVASTLVSCDEGVLDVRNEEPWLENLSAWILSVTRQDGVVVGNVAADAPLASPSDMDLLGAFGFASTVAVPAPSKVGPSRVSVLCIGSTQRGFFDAESCALLRPLATGMAMELSAWTLQHLRAGLFARARISDVDLDLLRHEAQGHSSKVIARYMDVDLEAVDSRFKRLNRRLGVAFRRDAVRIAQLYGLI